MKKLLFNNLILGYFVIVQSPSAFASENGKVIIIPTYVGSTSSRSILKAAPNDQCGDMSDGDDTCADSSTLHPLNQFVTLSRIAKKMCLSGNWVRNFDANSWGGGHHWQSAIHQRIAYNNFRCLNWSPYENKKDDPDGIPFACQNPAYQTCNARSIGENEAKARLEFLSSLELIGIPQVLIKTNDATYPEREKITCFTYPDKDYPIPDKEVVIPHTIKELGSAQNQAIPEFAYKNGDTRYLYYTASDLNNFQMGNYEALTTMFSENEFTCCLPSQKEAYDFPITSDMCCTGTKDPHTPNRCCLPDYTNVTVYLNRYVSSEAQEFDPTLFDAYTGKPTLMSDVHQMVKMKNLCCSGQVAQGAIVDSYPIAGSDVNQSSNKVRRFIDQPTDRNATQYDHGKRWNGDLYCLPSTGSSSSTGGGGNNAGNLK